MKVFLTGGTGFVGRAVLEAAGRRSIAVRALVRSEKSLHALGVLATEIETVKGDIFSADALYRGMEGCDAVIHLVGIIREQGEQTFEKVHVEGTRAVVDAALRAGISRYLHMSAENTRDKAPDRYHSTKFEAERYVRASGLRHTIFRPSMMFGKHDSNFNELARIIRISPVVPVIGDGSYVWQPVSVDNVAELFISALMSDKSVGKTYEIRGPEKFTFVQILDLIMEILGRKRPKAFVPVSLMRPVVSFMGLMPSVAPITPEQMKMLLDEKEPPPENFSDDFPMRLTRLEEGLKEYLVDEV